MRVFYSIAILLLSASAYAGGPMIVAHRGASHDAPQNTIPAFKLAWEQGADAIEGDFHLTKDGHIVCIHDRDTKKVANANLVVSDSTLAELRQVDVGAWKDQAFQGALIPTIAEVFSTIPQQKKIYIEVKCGPEIIPALLREVDQSGLTDEQVIEAVREHGYEWHVWTVNDLEEAERMTALGPQSIITDVPAHIKAHLVERTPAVDLL